MKRIFIFSAFTILMLSCKTQKNLELNYSDYEDQFARIDMNLKKGFPEQAIMALDSLITEAKSRKNHKIATLGILRKINIKNLDLEDFQEVQMPYLERELKSAKDSISVSFLSYTLAMANKVIWDSSRNRLANELEGDSNADGAFYKSSIDSFLNIAITNASEGLRIKDLEHFFLPSWGNKSITLSDFYLSEKITLYKSGTFEKFLGELEQRRIISELYDELISNCRSKKQRELELEFTIDKYQFLDNDFGDIEVAENDSLRYIIDYYIATKKYQDGKHRVSDKRQASEILKSAKALFSKVRARGDSTYRTNALAYESLIEKPELQVLVEKVLIPGQKSLVYLNYTNIEKVYVKIYKYEKSDYLKKKYTRNTPPSRVKEIFSEELSLPQAKYPFVSQSTEISLPALDAGYYGIAINTDQDFEVQDKGPIFYTSVLSSKYTISSYFDHESQESRLSCIDRITGEQVDGATFTLYKRIRRRGNQGDKMTMVSAGKGNPEYAFTPDRNENLFPFVEYDKNYYLIENGIYPNYSNGRNYKTSTIYTDRSIYRPGQEVNFFGITYEVDVNGIPSIYGRSSLEIFVSDNFGNEIDKISIETDEDGSFSGSFLIPVDIQNGNVNMRIQSADNRVSGYHGIRVEEYKRPKFKIEFEELKSKFKLGDRVKVSANVDSYTGLPVKKAKVRYKVYRSAWWPYFYRSYNSYFPTRNNERTLIKSGEGETDEEGRTVIDFLAERSISNPNMKNYSYSVELEVVDQSGETQTITKTLNISEQAVFLKFEKNSENGTYLLETVNAENQRIEAEVEVKIYEDLDKTFKIRRFWQFPDTNSINANDYPYYTFKSEDLKYKTLRYQVSKQVKDSMELNLMEILGPGTYKVEIASGGEKQISQVVEINDFESQVFGNLDAFYLENAKDHYLLNDVAKVRIGSNIVDLPIQILKFRSNKVVESTFVKLNKVLSISELIDSSDYGGYSYLFRTFYKNRVFTKSLNIEVPWKEKELIIKPTSIRYVTQPGAPETWTFKVTDNDGNPIKARFLSSMYDASLDNFNPHRWGLNIYPNLYGVPYYNYASYAQSYLNPLNYRWNRNLPSIKAFNIIPEFRFRPKQFSNYGNMDGGIMRKMSMESEADAVMVGNKAMDEAPGGAMPPAPPPPAPAQGNVQGPPPPVRTNLSETVFFLSDLETDTNGNVNIDFTNNDALTTWKLQNFAFTTDLKYGFSSAEINTRKDLMIQANQPRFLRSGDKILLAAKCMNLSEGDLLSEAQLSIYDILNKRMLNLEEASKRVRHEANGEVNLFWEVEIPSDVQLVKLTYALRSEKHNDAEEHIVKVFPDEKFLTESRTIIVSSNGNNSIKLDEFAKGEKRISSLTIESVGSPAWYAIQSLPYLAESEHENAEALFNRFFANSLALKILSENPRIEKYYKEWQKKGNLDSKLLFNKELKNIDIKQTPWLRNALSEEEVLKNIAVYFNSNTLQRDLGKVRNKLESMQLGSGGFSWFEGGRANYFISQNILEGITKLQRLGIGGFSNRFLSRLLDYCNLEAKTVYEKEHTHVRSSILKNVWINRTLTISKTNRDVKWHADVLKEVEAKWYEYGVLDQAIIANIFIAEERDFALEISQSLLEKSYHKSHLGRFWNLQEGMVYSHWQIGLQSSLIQLFDELGGFEEAVEEMKFWLITNKRTNAWTSSLATSNAVYALCLGAGSAFDKEGKGVETFVDGKRLDNEIIEGVNYSKNNFDDKMMISDIREVSFKNSNENKTYASVFLQYFQDYEEIESKSDQQLSVKKEIYLVKEDDNLLNVNSSSLRLGDRVRVRLLINSDRQMQFIHLSDDRPSGAEPVITSSRYQWGGSLSYYQAVKDTKTDFFIEAISKGQYVIEYDMFINNLGVFNSGIAQIQNYYAPEFSDYSKSVKIKVGK